MIVFNKISYTNGIWRFEWASGLGSVRVVLWGKLIDTTSDNFYEYEGDLYSAEDYPPPIEVVGSDEKSVSENNIPYLTLQWYRVDCERYRIERKVDGEWEAYAEIRDDELVPVVTYMTPVLDDQTEEDWRVKAVNEEEREGAPLTYQWKIVRPPDPPESVLISYNEGKITIAEGE